MENLNNGEIICKVTEAELQDLRKIEDENIDLGGVMQRFLATAMATQGNLRQKKEDWFSKIKAAHGLDVKDPSAKFSVSPETGEIKAINQPGPGLN